MRAVLLGIAAPLVAAAVPAAPAIAQFAAGPATAAPASPGAPGMVVRDRHDDGDRPNWRKHRRVQPVVVLGGPLYPREGWALYNNRSWEPDSFNDWWHDRPDRAYPRWVQNNQNCDRLWWGGGAWRCSW